MKEELEELIQNSPALDEVQKRTYLVVIRHLSDEKLEIMYKIFKDEAHRFRVLKSGKQKKFSEIDRKYILEMQNIINEGESVIKEAKGEELLDKLDNI